MAMDQEQLIRMLAETQARLDALEEENRALKRGIETVTKKLEEETELRIASEKRAQEIDVKRDAQEREKTQKLLEMQKKLELDRQKQKAAYLANLNAADINGFTQLHHACRRMDYPTINRLIREGADPNLKSKDGHTCLDLARGLATGFVDGASDLVLLLRAHGAKGEKYSLLPCEQPPHLQLYYDKFTAEQKQSCVKMHQARQTKVAELLKM